MAVLTLLSEGGGGAEAVTSLVVLRDSLMKQGVLPVEYSLGRGSHLHRSFSEFTLITLSKAFT